MSKPKIGSLAWLRATAAAFGLFVITRNGSRGVRRYKFAKVDGDFDEVRGAVCYGIAEAKAFLWGYEIAMLENPHYAESRQP